MIKAIDEAVRFIRSKSSLQPRAGVILGSGLGDVVDALKVETSIPYSEIPGARASTVVGHQGRMILAHVHDTPVVVMQGRVHFYEGYDMAEVMFLSRVIGRLGIKQLIVTNAAGGINTGFKAGDLMVISDHINMMGANPLRGPNIDDLGVRFPDMSEAYPESLRDVAKEVARELGQLLQEGVVQSFNAKSAPSGATLLAAVGPLQFEVVQWRLQSEYGAESRLTPAPWTMLRWVEPHPLLKDPTRLIVATGVSFGADKFENPVVLFPNEWTMRYFQEKNPELKLHALPLEQTK